MSVDGQATARFDRFRTDFEALREQVGQVVVGQEEAVQCVLTALAVGGHVLLEGLPGLGKTVLARTLADVADVMFRRIQCTSDLMATDVIGTYVIMETPQGRRTFEFQKGPLFANVVLADQINRTPPKTQSAMLEAMDAPFVTVSTETFELPRPHFIIATQNPLDSEGTFPLPEAQLDRFLLTASMRRPSGEELETMLDRTTGTEDPITRTVVDADGIAQMAQTVRLVSIEGDVRRRAVALVTATHPDDPQAPDDVRRYVRHGSSPRGARALVLASKARAILAGRDRVATEDLSQVAPAALAHRLVLTFEGQAEGVRPEDLIEKVVETVGG